MPEYDYIIIGAGASGLLLAAAIGEDNFFSEKNILLIEKSQKNTNDRTWCFWEDSSVNNHPYVSKIWDKIKFKTNDFELTETITPFGYKKVEAIDFYTYQINKLKQYSNIKVIGDEVLDVIHSPENEQVKCKTSSYTTKYVFDSRFNYEELFEQSKYPVLQQHFIGWFIKTKEPYFDENIATFMDFSISQNGNTRFMYVLPTSKNEALVEYTLFSDKLLEKEAYENTIKTYLKEHLKVKNYTVEAIEQGNIPMTCYKFWKYNTEHYIKIGIAGGWAKSSTGYTFYKSYKKVNQLKEFLKTNQSLLNFEKKTKYWYYDLLLLDVLSKKNKIGSTVFGAIFKNCPPQMILRFLDEDSSLWEDFQIIWACPKIPFMKALLKRLFL
ncbi:lycopene cyclase [Croceivirga lutea]|uniref:lycopene cyclase family protein n=1 Tax=Croceivirga lutea TaxID=1775167 RepID=UPI00163A0781|nr:lycopene cyclase family protein [Croceivirga lutea]GGG40478.1 lycopene cyclase [Croceivirga lutea]